MNYYGTQVNNLIEELRRLPGIGGKSAQRLAFHIINMPQEHVEHLAEVLVSARKNIRYCKCCCTLTDGELCPICASDKRDHSTIMVVEHTKDLAAYEKTGQYNGVYHVLQGTLVPSLGKGPDDIRFKELMERLDTTPVKELILATNSSLDGEATAMYITKKVKPRGIRITRIASGVPIGGELEYIDEVTLLRALEGYMIQDTDLFHDSIKNNLRIAKLTATDEEIIESGEFSYGSSVFFHGKKKYEERLESKYPYLKVINIETVFPSRFNQDSLIIILLFKLSIFAS